MKILHLIILFLISTLMVECQSHEAKCSEEDMQRMNSIDDTMDANPSYARQQIELGMRNATDSMTYYEYMSRLGRYFNLSSTPDSITFYIMQVIDFANRQPVSERCNSLLASAYNYQANRLHNIHKNNEEVIELYNKAYALSQKSNIKSQTPNICANLGDAYVFKNDLPMAAHWYRRALFLVDSLNLPKKEEVTLYMGLGRIYLLLGDYQASLNCYQQTEAYFHDMSLNMQAYYLNNYGSYYYYAKKYEAALSKFLELKMLLQRHGKGESYEMYLCYLNLSDVYLNLHQLRESQKCLDIVEPYMRKIGDHLAIYYCNTIRIGQAVENGNMNLVAKVLAREETLDNVDFSLRKIRNRYLRKYYEEKGDYQCAYKNLVADNLMNDSLEHNRTNMRAMEIMQRFAQDTLRLHHQIAMEHKDAIVQESKAIILTILGLLGILALLIALMVVVARRKEEKARLHIMSLRLDNARNRISPHFVFNVLNNKIISSNKKDGQELLELAKLIRANLDMSCQMAVTIREELDFVRQYVKVEKKLITDPLDFSVEVDGLVDIDKIKLPSMFVQILTENAFVHGLMGWEGQKRLSILVDNYQDKYIRIVVADNGKGFDARCMGDKPRTGLNIIRQTISVINERNRNKMSFQLHNKSNSMGKVVGCEAILLIPQGIKLL